MKPLFLFFFLLWLQIDAVCAQKKNDTFSVYFDLDIAQLNREAHDRLDSLLYFNKIHTDVPISIIGYADFLNTDEYNLTLSRKRAANVRDYLLQAGLESKNIKLWIGKGEVKRIDTAGKKKGIPKDRRVDIVMEYVQKASKLKDVHINMKPSEKLIIPPSTGDPNFDISNIPTGKTFILKNIYFPMGRHFPKQNSYEDLDMLLRAMNENPEMAIQIEGHVCCVANMPDALDLDSHEIDLSINRARFIYEWLRARGISPNRIKYVGYGRSRPIIEDEQTEEEASINRRVEIRILRK
ncbi:MAG: OmpA family protein [Bacteroidetes bacterium]|nr:OmpA family protein [Bacteroidota bacterium]MBS1739841.1 OmpA family protein [Bacteroidota bacterium]